MKKKHLSLIVAGLAVLSLLGPAPDSRADETGLFTSIAPDAMIVLDLSGSMKWNPPGDHDSWNSPINEYSDPTCSGPFYDDNWHSGYSTYCSRFEIARKTLFSILDDNHTNVIDSQDETSLNIRIGLGKFQGSNYVKLRDIGTKYSLIYCGSDNSCTQDQASGDNSSINYWMNYSNVVGATPLVTGLAGVKTYLDTHKAADAYKSCRQKFVILVYRRGRHDVLQRLGQRHPVGPVQAQARVGARGQGPGRCRLQGLRHRHGEQHARLTCRTPSTGWPTTAARTTHSWRMTAMRRPSTPRW